VDDLELEDSDRSEIDHDTKDTPGMVDITATILKKISLSGLINWKFGVVPLDE
jgi:hypothetical protein